jgi:predicted HTH transcriptional regulator
MPEDAMPLNKPLESINEADLLQLIDRKESERRLIEYKQCLHGNGDGEIKEFLADVTPFANADGGDLVYGMEEDSAIPTKLTGLDIGDPDSAILRLESSIRDGIDPRICGVHS